MSQELIYISIIILILFLMYVYKKKCDEDYYLSIIQATQQQYMYQNKNFPGQNFLQPFQPQQFYNNSYPGMNYYNAPYNNYNNINNHNPFKTPENRYNSQYITPSPIHNMNEKYGYNNNGNRKHIMEDQILYNKLNSINEINNNNYYKIGNNQFENVQNNKYLQKNIYEKNNNINGNNNKKIFKLADFLSENKRNNLSDKFNKAANDDF